MMLIKSFLRLSFLLFSFTPYIPQYAVIGITEILIPPLSTTQNTTIKVSGSVKGEYHLVVDYMRSFDAGHNVILDVTEKGSSFSYETLYLWRWVASGTTHFRVILTCSALRDGVQTIEYDIQTLKPSNFALKENFEENKETAENIVFYSNGLKSYSILNHSDTHAEKFNFSNFKPSQKLDFYNSLNINNLSFQYSCLDFDCTIKESFIYLQNINDWFSHIGTSYGAFRKLEVVPINKNNTITFEFKNPFFVNPTTNEMSMTRQDGFMQTKKIFFPKNGFKDFSKLVLMIDLKGVGINESLISQTFSYEIGRNYFGNCYDSEYCIQTKEGQSEYDIGEVEEK